ncbi:MAG: hypothetical protein KGQ83_03775, partial [Planctomycetes bacterium]|nr:hypothetical protein [Planctomycetota bacterium]
STLESVRNNFEFLKEMDIMTTPSVTAHLLHHRQTLFEGTPDYYQMMRETTNTNGSFTNYEIFYRIRNPNVETFSEIISNVCSAALSLLPKDFNCEINASNTGIESTSLNLLNNTLIASFDRTLSYFEMNTSLLSFDAIREIKQKLIHEVEKTMRCLMYDAR